jgi:lipoprotein-releasing system ATP-binding protein
MVVWLPVACSQAPAQRKIAVPGARRSSFSGDNVFSWSKEKLAGWRNAKIGFVFQFHHLLPEFTALENVMIPSLVRGDSRKSADHVASSILSRVGLSHRFHHKPGELSGGEQQRVALARALVLRPSLVLADEPTGNLDRKNSLEVEDLLLDLNKELNLTLVVVTHAIEEAAILGQNILLLGTPPNTRPQVIPNPGFGTPDYRESPAYSALCRRLRAEMK